MPKTRNALFFSIPILTYFLKWVLIGMGIGGIVGTASAGFLVSLDWVTNYREAHCNLLFLLPLAGLFIGYVYHYYGKKVAAGTHLILDSIKQSGATIPFKMAPFVYFGTLITHFFGGSAGREGTALQMAAALIDPFSKPLQLTPTDRNIMLKAALAAGFGAVFGTPLAGAVFALEVVFVGKMNYKAFFPVVVAAFLADGVVQLWNVPHTHYPLPEVPQLGFQTLSYSILAGILFGLCAVLFSKSMHFVAQFFNEKIAFPPLRPFVGGLLVVVAVLAIGTTKYIGLGIPTLVQAFYEPTASYDFALKIAFTVLTLASGFKGGEVTPLFFIGATLGSALSFFIPLPTALLAGMGFVAVFAGATKTPLACIVMGITLFGPTSSCYLAVACLISYLISGKNSIYQKSE